MRKTLGIDPDMVYIDGWEGFDLYLSDDDHYQPSLNDFIDLVKDDAEFKVKNGETLKVHTTKVKKIQYHFPSADDDDVGGTTPEEFLSEVLEYTFSDIGEINDDLEIKEEDYEIKSKDFLKDAYKQFLIDEDIYILRKALEIFRKNNEHLYFYSPAKDKDTHEFICEYDEDYKDVKLTPVKK